VPAVKGIERVRDITCGVDAGVVGAQRCVDDDAVVDRQAGSVCQFRVRQSADGDEDHLRRNLGAVVTQCGRDAASVSS